jgi:glycosyltransferase involved in cell wall biosynthesis
VGRKYLFVINSFLAGGAEMSLVEMLPRLVDDGVTPIIASLYYREVGFEEEVRGAGYDVRLLSGKGRLGKARALRSLIRDESPDLVYTSLFDADLAGWLATLGLGVPLISNLANTAYDPARLADPNIDERRLKVIRSVDGYTSRHGTDHFHAVSQAVKDSTVATLGVDPTRITVVKRGRDAERLGMSTPERRAETRDMLNLPDDAQVVVTVGRQEYQKGHRYLIEAFAQVAADHPRARLVITGREGHATSELKALIDALGIGSAVTILGHRSDVPDVLAASDLFVFPSLYEGLGGALIEALALALPVVASDIPALREVVIEGENALLVPSADPDALQAAISSLLDDPERMEDFGQRSREIFDAEFRAEVAMERMVALLTAVAGGSARERERTRANVSAIPDILPKMRDRRGLLIGDRTWIAETQWRSFASDFVKAHSVDGDVAVKFGDGWGSHDAQFIFREEDRVRGLFADLPSGRVDVPPALGWSEDPPAVALDFVDADKLFPILNDRSHPLWDDGGETMLRIVRSCGEAIGAYHAAEVLVDDPIAEQAALDTLLGAARRMGVPKRTILLIAPRLKLARGYRFSPNDFLVDHDRKPVMIDPPHVRRFDPVHSDVSTFIFELRRSFVGDGPMPSVGVAATQFAELREAFIEGYAATGPISMNSQTDEWVIRFFEISRILGFAYARIRRSEPLGAVAPARWAAQARRRLGAPPRLD